MERVLRGGEPHYWSDSHLLICLLVGFDPEQLTRIRLKA